jgi:hypothetical protein
MLSECRLFTSGVRSDVQGDLGRERSYTTTNYDFRSATWAGELAADIISGSESFPATALLPCGPAMAAARGKSNGNWARHSWECGGAEVDGLSFFRSSPCCTMPCFKVSIRQRGGMQPVWPSSSLEVNISRAKCFSSSTKRLTMAEVCRNLKPACLKTRSGSRADAA